MITNIFENGQKSKKGKKNKILFHQYFSFMFVIILSVSFYSKNSFADNYYDTPASGWHWYDDPLPEQSSKNEKSNTQQNPVLQMDAVKQALKTSLDKALLSPTPQNVSEYIAMQNQWSSQASRFSRVWQYVLLQHPELDYSLKFPTNETGRQVYIDQKEQKEHSAIQSLANHSGLFFFYRSTCPYCQRFAPILKDFSDKYGIAVIPITTDGIALPEFPNTRIDQGQAKKFHVSMEPALFTVDPYTQKVTPVSYGLLSEDELKTRILDIATHFAGDGT